ncbi:hypothetical protein [Streptomyces sp. NBC_01264]|uniref:hypothetical protein n=1 Tax=Streptomyces sp. NBC_01264 TaxID=2903804 RepID=UPI0022545954|nr:hypothetical protein [Streptomyces sp. NBC_01264]MCX4775441.1 hypothetical protein [Streptomyces sp. NBC_01264]
MEILLAGGAKEAVKLLKVWGRDDSGFPEYGREPLQRLARIATSKQCRSDVKEVWNKFDRQMNETRTPNRKRKEPPVPPRVTQDKGPYKRPLRRPDPFGQPKKFDTRSPEEGAFLLDTIRTRHHLSGGLAAAPMPTWVECLEFLKAAYPSHAVPAYLAPSVQQQALGAPAAWQVTLDVDWDQFRIEQEGRFDPALLGYVAVLVHREGSEAKSTPCLLKVTWNDGSGYTPYLEMPQ